MAPEEISKRKRTKGCNYGGGRNEKTNNCRTVSKLLNHIFYHVFCKLPAKTIIQCRCMCKTWCQTLLEPYFAKLHLPNSTPGLLLKLCVDTNSGHDHEFHLLERVDQGIEALPYNDSNDGLLVTKFSKDFNIFDPQSKMEMISTCNGLVLFCNLSDGNPICVTNPITGEYTILPPHKSKSHAHVLGFGMCSNTRDDEYKVVRICDDLVQVHALGTTTWTCIDAEIDEGFLPDSHHNGLFLNGIFHWVAVDYDVEVLLLCTLGLERGQFQYFMFPIPQSEDEEFGCYWWTLGTKGEFLTASGYPENANYPDFEVWMMKEHGSEESWTRLFVVKDLSMPTGCGDFFKVIKFLDDDRVLGLVLGRLFVYHVSDGTHAWVDYYGYEDDLVSEALVYTPSFVSLKDYVPRGSLEVFSIRTV